MPCAPFDGSVTAMATQTPAEWPLVVKVFAPFSTQLSPRRSAVVRVPPASEPAPGSVSDHAPSIFPAVSCGRYFLRCASVPNL